MKPQIYIFAMHLAYGGVENAVCAMGNLFAKIGYPVKIICTYNMPNSPAYPLDSKIEIEYLLKEIPNREEFKLAVSQKKIFQILKGGFKSVKILYLKKTKIKKAIKSIREGIVITTRNEDSVVLSKYGDSSVYKIAQLHHDHEFKEKYVNDFKHHYSNVDCFALLTDQLRDEVEEMMKEGNNNHTECVTIPNFIEKYDEAFDLSVKEKYCIAVGRLHQVKGFDRLINMFKKISELKADYHLKIVGGGDMMESLQRKIIELGLEKSIELTGPKSQEEVQMLMKKASLYLMTSYSEGLPFVLIEAQSKMLPCVAFDVRVGPRAIITDGKDGFLIPDKDEKQYIECVVNLLEHEDLRKEFSQTAYKNGKKFTQEEVSKVWETILEKGCQEINDRIR